jgi:hypothetical protein
MRNIWRLTAPALLGLVLAAAAACSGSNGASDGAARDSQRPGRSSEPLVLADPRAALATSAERFTQDVKYFQAEFEFHIAAAGFEMGGKGEFAFESPDRLYMRIDFSSEDDAVFDFGELLGRFEVLAHEDKVYINVPFFGGWVVLTAEDLGEDFADLEDLFSGKSPFDYAAVIETIGDEVDDLGEERLDGKTVRHYRVSVDAADLMNAFSEALGGGPIDPETAPLEELSGPIGMDLWVDVETGLPHRIVASGNFGTDVALTRFDLSMDFVTYNADVQIPNPPDDAKTFEEIFGDLGFEFESESGQDFESFFEDSALESATGY